MPSVLPASVACPIRSTSRVGVNHRMPKPSCCGAGAKNTVSDRFISEAMACIVEAGSQASSGQTAAGLPAKGPSANASTMNIGTCMALGSSGVVRRGL